MMVHDVETELSDGLSLLPFCAEHGQEPERSFGPVDETTYLLRSKANRERLLAAIENVNTGRNLIELPMATLH